MQLLIVKDESTAQQLYEQHIRPFGHDVTVYNTAESALAAYQQTFYPFIIVDLGSPRMDGLEFCRRIRSLPQGDHSMILIITGHDKPEDLQAALDAGADDYLMKPFGMETLQTRLMILERQFRDRTQRKQAEEKIREQHNFLENILESLTYPFYVVDPNTYTIIMVNSAARQNGISPASACHALLHHNPAPCSGTNHPCPIQQVKITQKPAIVEHLHHDQEGNPRYVEIHAYPIFDDGGNVAQIIEYALDITERKHVEEQLRLSEERYALAQKEANIGSWDWNIQTGYLHWSDQIEPLFGFARGEFGATYKAFLECVHPDDRQYVIDSVNATLEENRDYAIEHRIVWPDGTVRWVSETGDVIRNEDGKAIRMLGIVQDITERKQAEEELQHAKKVAETASQAKSDFLANMSHELRTPLNAILGYTQILNREKRLTEKQRKAIDTIHRSGEHLLMMISDILDLSKIEARKMDLEQTAFNLRKCLGSVAEIARIRAQQQGISFATEFADDLPKRVRGDEKCLRQVLLNLLNNAVKFTKKGKVTLRVMNSPPPNLPHQGGGTSPHPSPLPKGKGENDSPPLVGGVRGGETSLLHFEVEDTGIGIPPEHLKDIFLPFHQVKDSSIHNEGTGLGLTITQNLVRLMGSELQVTSTPGQGTTFWFDIEFPEAAEGDEPAETKIRNIIGFKGDQSKILITDDEDENRTMLKEMLLPLGFEIIEAVDGHGALEKAGRHHPDLILMDWMMPGLNGFEAIRRLRQLPALNKTIIISISASAFKQTQQDSLAAGSDDFLAKPIRLDDLLEKLQRHLKLEWVYEEAIEDHEDVSLDINSQLSAPEPIIPPSQEELALLFQLAMRGDVHRLQEHAKRLEASDPRLIPFGKELYRLATTYQIDEIQELLAQYMEEQS